MNKLKSIGNIMGDDMTILERIIEREDIKSEINNTLDIMADWFDCDFADDLSYLTNRDDFITKELS
jgi:hypothetical protein